MSTIRSCTCKVQSEARMAECDSVSPSVVFEIILERLKPTQFSNEGFSVGTYDV